MKIVRATCVRIACVIGCYPIATKIDPKATIGEDGILADGVASDWRIDANGRDLNTVAVIEGNGIARAWARASDYIKGARD